MRGVQWPGTMPLVCLNIPQDHQASRNLPTPQTQRSARSKAPSTLRHKFSAANWPPLLSATLVPSFRPITTSALCLFLTKLKATFHLGLEPTLIAKLPPSDQRANHSATLTPRQFRLLDFYISYLFSTSISGTWWRARWFLLSRNLS